MTRSKDVPIASEVMPAYGLRQKALSQGSCRPNRLASVPTAQLVARSQSIGSFGTPEGREALGTARISTHRQDGDLGTLSGAPATITRRRNEGNANGEVIRELGGAPEYSGIVVAPRTVVRASLVG